MKAIWIFLLLTVFPQIIYSKQHFESIKRERCVKPAIKVHASVVVDNDENNIENRLRDLRKEMQAHVLNGGVALDAYIVTSFDEHLNEYVAEYDERRRFISGFSGKAGTAVITLKHQALWTDERFTELANNELDCEWKIFRVGERPTISEWLASHLASDSMIGIDPKMVSHMQFKKWEEALRERYLRFVPIHRNLIDAIWCTKRPEPRTFYINIHPLNFAGEKWQSKLQRLKEMLQSEGYDAMVVTAPTEIAYLFNLRGFDIPYTPVFKSYAIVTQGDAYLYVKRTQTRLGLDLHLNSKQCTPGSCAHVREYNEIWGDLRQHSQRWRKVLIPAPSVFDHGASQAIFASFYESITSVATSPIIYMRARKNEAERQGMRKAHVRDAAAVCDVMAYLEEGFMAGEDFSEMRLANEFDRTRRSQNYSKGLSIPTTVAFGPHAGHPYYVPSNRSNSIITDENVILMESGGQYLDGTTDVSRTVHLGKPTEEQKRAYTYTLQGLIRLSMLQFPENVPPGDIDIVLRGPQWNSGNDYPHGTGHGIGAYSAVHESPVNIAYNSKHKHPFREGYFFTAEPGYYRPGYYGIRLENVLEVVDTGEKHPTGVKFLAFKDITLVPFEPNLIERSLLSATEKRWLNDYNARIREHVGDELKKRTRMHAFYWMMNKTKHVIEYLPEAEYKGGNSASVVNTDRILMLLLGTIIGLNKLYYLPWFS